MEKRIVYTQRNGGVCIVAPAARARASVVNTAEAHERAKEGDASKNWSTSYIESPVGSLGEQTVTGKNVKVEFTSTPTKYRYETDEEFIERIRLKDVPSDAVGVAVVDASSLPKDRAFRDAWEHDGLGFVSVNLTKAREIHRQRIRQAREPLLSALDVAFMRALGRRNQAEVDAIEAKRQILRDAPDDPVIDAAKTIDELKAAWPLSTSEKSW